jgi:hypothetical protein
MTSAAYPTRLTGRAIRVLELLPGDQQEDINCRLVETSLDDVLPYEALSYVWGDSNERERISCNGQDMKITISLAQAIRRLRPDCTALGSTTQSHVPTSSTNSQADNAKLGISTSATPRLIWADALCINQGDVTERSSQVQLMREVYSKATKVVVWLGPDAEGHGQAAIAAVELIALFLTTYQKFVEDMRQKGIEWNNQGRGHFTFELCEALLQSKNIESPWPSLRALFMLPYWSRTWCVQEVHLARDITLYFGDGELSGKSLGAFTDFYMRESHRRSVGGNETKTKEQLALHNSAVSLAWTQFNYHDLNAKELCLVCDDFRLLQATNPRDKVYGVLGMWRGDQNSIEVDYNKSVAEVYTDVVLQAIRARKDLFVLRFVDHEHDRNFAENNGFPSWVPRWDQGDSWTFSWLDKSPVSATQYQAETPDEALARSGVLKLKGVMFDRVTSVSNVLDRGSKSFMSDAAFRQSVIDLWLEATGAKPNDKFSHQVSISELATTITHGIIKGSSDIHDRDNKDPNSWLDMSELDTDAGREFLYNFKSFMDSDTYPGHPRGFDMLLACYNRRLFRTSRGFLGLGRSNTREGDVVTVLHGGRVPFILRLMGEPGTAHFAFVGDCFVHSIMDKEVYGMVDEGKVMTGVFEIH